MEGVIDIEEVTDFVLEGVNVFVADDEEVVVAVAVTDRLGVVEYEADCVTVVEDVPLGVLLAVILKVIVDVKLGVTVVELVTDIVEEAVNVGVLVIVSVTDDVGVIEGV